VGEGECHRQIAGQALFAKVRVRLEPTDAASSPVAVTRRPEIELPAGFIAAAMEVLSELSRGGGTLGFPLTKLRITLVDGEARDGESNEIAFRIAAADAFHKALGEAGVVLLEPIMRLEINTPDAYVGDFVSDLQQRRAVIHRTQARGARTLIEAEAPLGNLFGYSSVLRSLSQGRATSTMEPSSYGPAPPEILKNFT
jgi:elongation factor G